MRCVCESSFSNLSALVMAEYADFIFWGIYQKHLDADIKNTESISCGGLFQADTLYWKGQFKSTGMTSGKFPLLLNHLPLHQITVPKVCTSTAADN